MLSSLYRDVLNVKQNHGCTIINMISRAHTDVGTYQGTSWELLLRVLRQPEDCLHALQRSWYISQGMALSPHCISTEIMCDGQMPPDSIKASSACLLIISVIKALLYLPETPERIAMAVDMAIVSIK